MSIFDREYKRYDSWYERNKFAYLSELNLLRELIPKKKKGLEVGVGTARFAEELKTDFGIDPSFNMIKIAKERGIKCTVASGENLPFRNNSFDYLTMIITICFIDNPAKALWEAKRVLRKKGKIIIGFIDKMSFLGKFYQKKQSPFYKQAKFFSIDSISKLLTSQAFQDLSYFQTLFDFPNSLNQPDKPKTGYGKGSFVVVKASKGD
ncbi:MAG: class I SAM-dependent methyltransferase [Candidatus Omnitrophica bacterium]|nr:class I SAM-dependent methyltransferase [Candidatus Omnitrophota bacterium]MCF7894208.1 class I SAM-dependent methyltransferase [Candidatus Omnitrophota bacterium]